MFTGNIIHFLWHNFAGISWCKLKHSRVCSRRGRLQSYLGQLDLSMNQNWIHGSTKVLRTYQDTWGRMPWGVRLGGHTGNAGRNLGQEWYQRVRGMEDEAGGLKNVSIVVCGCVLLFIFHNQLVHIGSHLPFMPFLMSPREALGVFSEPQFPPPWDSTDFTKVLWLWREMPSAKASAEYVAHGGP